MNQKFKGLTSAQVAESKAKYGTNSLAKKETESFLSMLIESFQDVWIKVLCVALALKFVLTLVGIFVPQLGSGNDFIEIISIIIAIILATGFSALSEYRNTSRSEALQEEYNKTYAKVIRDGKLISILTSDIVKGDIVLVQAGDKVPADGLIRSGSIKVSQAALNGEPRDEKKEETSSDKEAESTDYKSLHKVFMGSVVTSGEAYIEVTVVGDASELGKIAASIAGKGEEDEDAEERKDTSSLKLEVVAAGIGKLGMTAAAIAGILHVILSVVNNEGATLTIVGVVLIVAEALMLMASIVIMAVPEGLPMMNSLVQSMNTESMYKKNILVSHKNAFSDSAYMNILFSDKTGTITQGNLSLVEFILGNGKIVSDISDKDFIELISVNNLAKVSEGKAIGSNNMDRELLTYALKHGYDEDKKDLSGVRAVNGFDSEKKCATVDMKDGSVMWKGATENIINSVTHYIDENGKKTPFTKECREQVDKSMAEQTGRTMKLLSVAKIVGGETILYSILCLRDNVRLDAIETVDVLNTAGIQVVMVTGDAEETAVAIAKEAGIYRDGTTDIVLTHEELEAMSDDELKKKIKDLRVVSRAKPLDKKRLVSVAQSLDNVCGMTGDGVNDAPALMQADVGFAMGDGTAVAQEAGDVVIINNSLSSIKDCILNSRTMAKSVGKFLIFQLTVNVSTLLMNILAPILGWIEPFSIVQILWINLIMDTLAALAFGGEPILDRYMQEKPAKRTDNILTGYIKSAIATSSIFITIGSIVILENLFGILDYVCTPQLETGLAPTAESLDYMLTYDKTFMFAFFIYAIIFNSLNTRSETLNLFEHIGQNKKFMIVMGGIFVLQTLLLHFGGAVFGTVQMTFKGYLVAIILGAMIIPVDFIRKLIMSSMNKKM